MDSSAWNKCAGMHDESVINDYLRKKMKMPPSMFQQIADLDDIFTVESSTLGMQLGADIEVHCLDERLKRTHFCLHGHGHSVDNQSAGKKWFFSRCTRTSDCRTTRSGFWIQTENLELVRDGLIVVEKRTSAFYKGRCPKAKLTEWRMNEYISHYVSNKLKVSSAFCCLYCNPAIQQYAIDTSSPL